MGILAFFGLGGALSPKRIAQASKLACNPFAQPEVRMRELQRLLKQGTFDGIAGAVRRFGANAQGHIADEEEKAWLTEALVDLGSKAKGPLETYIQSDQKLTYALLAYRRIVGADAARDFFVQALRQIGPSDHQKVEAKQQLVAALVEDAPQGAVQQALAPFLADHSDDVIWSVLDGVEHSLNAAQTSGDGHPVLSEALLQGLGALLVKDDASARISGRVAHLLARFGAPLHLARQALPPSIAEQYFVDAKGVVRARASA
jgi:hypothetical protein